IVSLNKAIKLNPKLAGSYSGLGQCYFKNKDYKNASLNFKKLTELTPGSAWAHHMLGTCLLRNGENALAIASFNKAIRLNPKLAGAHAGLKAALAAGAAAKQPLTEKPKKALITDSKEYVARALKSSLHAPRRSTDIETETADETAEKFTEKIEIDMRTDYQTDNRYLYGPDQRQSQTRDSMTGGAQRMTPTSLDNH
ncbi:MAG: tetratricopeptide repeat protein, partial [Candidatus Ancaeobacter aquaticus]|nr:tetratricopeptide repeat protein [Candidatus Ancaeobacter aquaticus]